MGGSRAGRAVVHTPGRTRAVFGNTLGGWLLVDLQGVWTGRMTAIAGDSRAFGAMGPQSWEVAGSAPSALHRARKVFAHEAMDLLLVRRVLHLLGKGLGLELGILLEEVLVRCRAIRLAQWAV